MSSDSEETSRDIPKAVDNVDRISESSTDTDDSRVLVVDEDRDLSFSSDEIEMPSEVNNSEVNTSEVNTPEVNTPEVNAPEVNAPEVNTPEVNTPEVNTPEVNASEIAGCSTSNTSARNEGHNAGRGRDRRGGSTGRNLISGSILKYRDRGRRPRFYDPLIYDGRFINRLVQESTVFPPELRYPNSMVYKPNGNPVKVENSTENTGENSASTSKPRLPTSLVLSCSGDWRRIIYDGNLLNRMVSEVFTFPPRPANAASIVPKTEGNAAATTAGNAVATTAGNAVATTAGNAVVTTEGNAVAKTEGNAVAKTEENTEGNPEGNIVAKTEEYMDQSTSQPLFHTAQIKTEDVKQELPEVEPMEVTEDLSVKVYWEDMEVLQFMIGRYQKLQSIFDFFAKREKVTSDNLNFTYNAKAVNKDDTPDSISYNEETFIVGALVRQSTSSSEQEKKETVPHGRTLKFQCQNIKKAFFVNINPGEKLYVAMLKSAEHFGQPMDKLKFFFDGDMITGHNSPIEMGLENGECIDIQVIE